MPDNIRLFFEACHPFGYPLLACSVILIAAIFYHLLYTGSGRLLRRLRRSMQRTRVEKDTSLRVLTELCLKSSHPLASLILFVIDHREDKTLPEQTEARLRLYMDRERVGMATISVITNIAPMLGILGTAWGLVDIFGVFGSPEAQEGVALGISKALYTTIFGLAIAVPGIIALTCFERGLERRAALINQFFTELLAQCGKR